MKHTLYVGLDTDSKHIDVAVADGWPPGEVRYWGQIANEPAAVDRLIKRLRKDGRALVVCYEAGPCGYGLYRQLAGKPGVRCQVVAPALIPRRPGDRVKTNRRDCLALAKLLRAEELTAIWVPDAAHEAMRDVVRQRSAARADVTRCRQRLASFLLRQGIRYATGKPWTKRHRVWLGRLAWAAPAHRLMFAELLDALDQTQARHDRLVDHLREVVPQWSLAWLVGALQALRGYRLVNAATVVAEIGDPRRFSSPRPLMAFLGAVPSEHSTGDTIRRGHITKAGNTRARTALIEAAWTHTRPGKAPPPAHHAPAVRAIAEKARHRLSRRYRRLIARGKPPNLAVTAIARESLGFIWAIAHAAAPGATPRR
ncbi:MAG TPA: IS110 family transposase [Stellaceae bacterium]|nr:IS110 family transposase [Stellaceae bacterium]